MPTAAFRPIPHAIIVFLPLLLLLLVPVLCASSFSFVVPISFGSSSSSVGSSSRRSSISRSSSEKSISSSSTRMSSSFLPSRPSFIEPEELLNLLQAQRQGVKGPTIKIIDVRDDDFEGQPKHGRERGGEEGSREEGRQGGLLFLRRTYHDSHTNEGKGGKEGGREGGGTSTY